MSGNWSSWEAAQSGKLTILRSPVTLAIWSRKTATRLKAKLPLLKPILPCKPEALPPAEDVKKIQRKLEGNEKKPLKDVQKKKG
jgi:hypothetical protein